MAPSPVVRRTLAVASFIATTLVASPALAADPSGSPASSASEEPAGGFPQIEIWQDGPLPPDIPAGQTIEVGFTAWDATGTTLARVAGSEVRVHPKTGKAPPTNGFTRTDWPGHLVASIPIPKGGLGTIEIGVTGQECHDDTGKCNEVFVPYTWGGIGPPPDASRALLVDASIHEPVDPIVSGQPFDVVADVTPRADWGADALALPAQLVLVAREVRGSSFSMADLNAKGDGTTYTGSMVIPEVGDAVLIVGFPTSAGDPDLVDASIVRVSVLGPGGESAPSPSARSAAAAPLPAGESLPIVPIALVLAVVIVGGIALTRALSDL